MDPPPGFQLLPRADESHTDKDGFTTVVRRKWRRDPNHLPQPKSSVKENYNSPHNASIQSRQPTITNTSKSSLNAAYKNDVQSTQNVYKSGQNKWNFTTTSSRAWNKVVKGNNIPVSIPLKFYQPREINNFHCAKMSEEVVIKAKKQWDNAIVVYVVGPKPYYPYFKDYILRVWKPDDDFSIYSKENGFYVIKFNNKKDRDKILEGGPYFYNKKLMTMKRWSLGMQLNKELLHTIPIWIPLPNLPLDYWTEEGISRIASVLGTPIRLDKVTESIIKIAYARVLIEINNSFKFPNKIPIITENDKMIWQEVNYEWKPSLCSNCASFGHAETNCQFNKV